MTDRTPIIAANWKLNILPSEAAQFVEEFKPLVANNSITETVICPSALAVPVVSKETEGSNIKTGGQNIYSEKNGAFTGENSADMLLDLNCEYVILGHSERRTIFQETSEDINKKVHHALQSGLKVILCVGELLEEREAGNTEAVVSAHVTDSLLNVSVEDMAKIVIAYEPVWAIGTGKTASPEQAEEVHSFIRKLLADLYNNDVAEATRIQYGGSVKPSNVKDLMAKENIDGALVGGASLKPDSFASLVNFNQ